MDLLFCISCFLPKKVQLKFVQNFETLKKKGVKTLNTFGPLCLWQCFIWDGCFYWNWLSKYISCWNFLLYFIWQSETRKICPLDLHFVENLNGKSPVRASPPLLCEFDMKFRRILSEMQKIPNVQGGDMYCARRLLFQQKVFHFLWSHHPASQSSLCMELDQFFTALWNTTFGSLFLQQVICYNWKILQLSDRLEKACLNLFCWFNRQARYS